MRVPSQTKQQASQHCEISLLSSARRQRKEDIFTFSVTNIGLQKIRRGIPFQKLRVPEQMRLCKTGGEYTTQKPHTHIHTHTPDTAPGSLRLAIKGALPAHPAQVIPPPLPSTHPHTSLPRSRPRPSHACHSPSRPHLPRTLALPSPPHTHAPGGVQAIDVPIPPVIALASCAFRPAFC